MIYSFGQCELDTERLELHRDGELQAVEPQVFSLITLLIENRDHVVSKEDLIAAIWHGRIVSDASLSSRISAARRAVGDTGRSQAIIRTMPKRGFRFVADILQDKAARAEPQSGAYDYQAMGKSLPDKPSIAVLPFDNKSGDPEQEYFSGGIAEDVDDVRKSDSWSPHQSIHFCTTPDGVQIAYATAGAGPPLVKAANWLNHLEYDWQSPVWRHLFRALAKDRLLVRYDARGNGLSDWEVEDISFEAFVQDLETVVDAVALKRFALFGISQGCAASIKYAIQHPERVLCLVLYGGYARGGFHRGSPDEIERSRALSALVRQGWGQENPAFRQMFSSLLIPDASPEQMQWFNDLQRVSASPENAIRIREAYDDINICDDLPAVSVPTLVLHCRNDAAVPFEEGRRMAGMIPGAKFVPLEGQNHLILQDEPAWPRFLEEVRGFLGEFLDSVPNS